MHFKNIPKADRIRQSIEFLEKHHEILSGQNPETSVSIKINRMHYDWEVACITNDQKNTIIILLLAAYKKMIAEKYAEYAALDAEKEPFDQSSINQS